MGAKEKLQKELDLLLEKMKFWRYVIFGIVSSVVGMLFGLSQNKVSINWGVITLFTFAFIGIVTSIIRLNDLTKNYQNKLELLEKEN